MSLKCTSLFFSVLLLFSPIHAQDTESSEPAVSSAEQSEVQAPVKPEVTAPEDSAIEESSLPVTFREKTVFAIFFRSENGKQKATEKSTLATTNLDKALTASSPLLSKAPSVEVLSKSGGKLEIRVRGYRITELEPQEFPASGFDSAKEYESQLRSDLTTFVDSEMYRLRIQRGALQFFLSIFFAVIGFVVFRQIHQGFNNAESVLEQKRESFQPVVVLSETLLSGQALGGLLAFTLAVGRMLTYVVVILTTIAAILGQFTTSRIIMMDFFSHSLTQIVKGFQSLLESIPGLFLAAFLIFLFQLGLNILDLFLKGARSGRISLKFLNSSRVPIVRFWGVSFLVILFFPLILASIFGRFNTPLESVILIAAAVLLLSGFPVLLNIAAGSFVLWQGNIKPGQWIEVGGKSGEVSAMSLHKITIVPEVGGRIYIPMVILLFQGCFEKREAPKAEFRVSVKRKLPLKETTVLLESLFPEEFEVKVSCLSLSASEYRFVLFTPPFQRDIRHEVLTALSTAHEEAKIELTNDLIQEVIH